MTHINLGLTDGLKKVQRRGRITGYQYVSTTLVASVQILTVTQFGAGYGSCPGQNVAKIELAKITSTLVRDYKIRQVDGEQEWKWKAYFTVLPHSWPVLIEKSAR